MSAAPALDWTELDDKAVDTVRVLAMDAVQKVGNGHPGTAMSLAPAAYLLFQKVMRHDPADPDWSRRDRFVLSAGHSLADALPAAVPRRLGPGARRPQGAAHLGQQDPGHPEHGHTAGVETTTGPLGQGIGNAVGMAMAARRRARPARPGRAPGASPFDHQVYAICSDGDIEEGVSHEASSIAGVQRLGNLTLIYDSNRISIEDDTNIALAEDVGARYEAYGWHVQTVDWTHGGTEYARGRAGAATTRSGRRRRSPTGRASSCCARSSPGRRPNAQNTGKAHGSALGDDEVAATKKVLGFDPEQHFEIPPGVLEHTRQARRARPAAAQAAWDEAFRPGGTTNPDGLRALLMRLRDPRAARRLGRRPADVRRRPEGRGDPQGVRRGDQRDRREGAGALGRLGRPRRVQQHHHRGRALVPARSTARSKMWQGDPYAGRVLHFGIREHGMGAIMNGIALHGGTRVFGGTFLTFSDYMRPVGAAGLADGAAGHLRLDPRLDRPRRGRPDPPADRAPRRAAGDPRASTWSARPTPTRSPPAGRRSWSTPTGPSALALTRQNVPVFPRGTDGFADTSRRAPRRLRAARRPTRGGAARRRPDRHRVGGPARRRGARRSWPRTASGPGSSRCRAGSGSTRRRSPTATP